MLKKFKDTRLFVVGLIMGLLLAGTTVFAANAIASATFNDTRVVFNGNTLDLPQPLISVVLEGQTNISNYMPVRAVLEAMGYVVDWDGANNAVVITSPTQPAEQPQESVVPAGFVGLRDIAENHGVEVDSRLGFSRAGMTAVFPVDDWQPITGNLYTLAAENNPGLTITVIVADGRTWVNEAELLQALRALGMFP